MNVLVTYASRHGATQGIAERIAAILERDGVATTLRPADDSRDVAGFDAFVIGGASYMAHWLKEATDFVRRNRRALEGHPVWLFSCGPLGTDKVDAEGRDVLSAAEPKEFAEFRETLHPREVRVFFGAYDRDAEPIGIAEHVMRSLPAARDALPTGDFRDWVAIEAWAHGIAGELAREPALV